MNRNDDIRRQALRAMKAVSAGALICAGLACSSDEISSENSWNISEEDTGSDSSMTDTAGDTTVADTGNDVADDTGGDVDSGFVDADSGEDATITDVGLQCNKEESTGVCPEGCMFDEDVDCCEASGCFWSLGYCGCDVPGPFVPPQMIA